MTDNRILAGEVQEDQLTASLEQFSTRFPSSFYLGAAIASIVGSLSFKLAKRDRDALFVGQWVAPFLLLGIYNKMVKQHGSDAATNNAPTKPPRRARSKPKTKRAPKSAALIE